MGNCAWACASPLCWRQGRDTMDGEFPAVAVSAGCRPPAQARTMITPPNRHIARIRGASLSIGVRSCILRGEPATCHDAGARSSPTGRSRMPRMPGRVAWWTDRLRSLAPEGLPLPTGEESVCVQQVCTGSSPG